MMLLSPIDQFLCITPTVLRSNDEDFYLSIQLFIRPDFRFSKNILGTFCAANRLLRLQS